MEKTIRNLTFFTADVLPEEDGTYLTVYPFSGVSLIDYTKEYGWNTNVVSHKYPITHPNFKYWCKPTDIMQKLNIKID